MKENFRKNTFCNSQLNKIHMKWWSLINGRPISYCQPGLQKFWGSFVLKLYKKILWISCFCLSMYCYTKFFTIMNMTITCSALAERLPKLANWTAKVKFITILKQWVTVQNLFYNYHGWFQPYFMVVNLIDLQWSVPYNANRLRWKSFADT